MSFFRKDKSLSLITFFFIFSLTLGVHCMESQDQVIKRPDFPEGEIFGIGSM